MTQGARPGDRAARARLGQTSGEALTETLETLSFAGPTSRGQDEGEQDESSAGSGDKDN